MEKFWNYVSVAILTSMWIIGAIHGKRYHNLDPFSSSFFVSWYYGLEIIWHSPDEEVLHEKVIQVVRLISIDPNNLNEKQKVNFEEVKKELNEDFQEIDTCEVSYVRNGAKAYMETCKLLQEEMINSLFNTNDSLFRNSNEFTQRKNKMNEQCLKFGLSELMGEIERSINDSTISIKQKLESNYMSYLELEKFQLEFLKHQQFSQIIMRDNLKGIFVDL